MSILQIHQRAIQFSIQGRVYWIRVSQLLQICHHGNLPRICNPSSLTSEEPFQYTSSVIGSFHYASAVHERLCTKLLESIQGLLPSAYMGLFLVYLKTLRLFLYASSSITLLRRTVFTFIWCKLQPMDIAEDIMAWVEVCLVTGTSYHHSPLPPIGRTMVLDLAMISFISIPYTVLHHNFHFFCLIASRRFRSSW